MQKFLIASGAACAVMLATAANAADLPIRKAPVIDVWSWSGFYGGVHFGSAWGQKEWSQNIVAGGDVTTNPVTAYNAQTATFTPNGGPSSLRGDPAGFRITSDSSHSVNGFLGGVQAGWNYQSGVWVWGVEAQWSWSNIKGKGSCGLVAIFNCSDKVGWLGTAAVRLGFAIDHALIFVKGGVAWAHDEYNVNILGIASPVNTYASLTNNRHGVMWGTGVEYMFTRNWSAKIEYDYMDLGTKNYAFLNPTGIAGFDRFYNNWDINQRIHLIKFGVNYHFDWAVAAKY